MAHVAKGPKESYQLPTGAEGIHSQAKLIEFARVVANSGAILIHRGTGTDTTGIIYTKGIDHLNMAFFSPLVGDVATTTVGKMPVVQYINGPTTLASVLSTGDAVNSYCIMMVGISFGN